MQPISNEMRKIIINAKERGEKVKMISLWTGIPTSSIYHIIRKYRKTGELESKPFLGRRSILTKEHIEEIKKTIQEQNDITLEELIEKLNLPIKKSRLSKVLISIGFSFKKRLYTLKHNYVKTSKSNVMNG